MPVVAECDDGWLNMSGTSRWTRRTSAGHRGGRWRRARAGRGWGGRGRDRDGVLRAQGRDRDGLALRPSGGPSTDDRASTARRHPVTTGIRSVSWRSPTSAGSADSRSMASVSVRRCRPKAGSGGRPTVASAAAASSSSRPMPRSIGSASSNGWPAGRARARPDGLDGGSRLGRHLPRVLDRGPRSSVAAGSPLRRFEVVDDEYLDPLFGAVVDATEAAIVDALFQADTVDRTGRPHGPGPAGRARRSTMLRAAGRLSG